MAMPLDVALAVVGMGVAAWIRWSGLYRQSLWVDEMSSYGLALQPLRHIVPNVLAVDGHPPLYIFMVHVAHFTFGLGTVDAVRLPSLLAGVATVGIVYGLARVIVGRVAAIVATALAIITPILVWYSREGRMYAVTWFFVMLSFLLLAQAVRSRRWAWLVPYTGSLALALYADISAVMALVPQGAMVGWFFWRNAHEARARWRGVGIAYVAGWLLFVPWLLVLPQQLHFLHGTFTGYAPSPATAWRLVLNFTGVEATYAYIFQPDLPLVLAAITVLAFACVIIAALWLGRGHPLFRGVVSSLTFGPVLMCVLFVAAGSAGVLLPRVMGLASFGLILAAAGVAELALRPRGAPRVVHVAGVIAVLVVLLSSTVSFANLEAHGYNSQNWRTAATTLAEHAQPGDAVIYYPLGLKIMVDAYLPAGSRWIRDGVGIWQAPDSVAESYFADWARGHPHVWFVFYAAAEVQAPVLDAWFSASGYRRVGGDPTAGYGVLEYVPAG
jgi:mannosyltransferase